MYFYYDLEDHSVFAAPRRGAVARQVCTIFDLPISEGGNPVEVVLAFLDDNPRGIMLNISAAFEMIVAADKDEAQDLAQSFRDAIELFYENKRF
ncbi:MAG: hypothetical protein MI864_21920 [Pseudomonadales bacterium]|nr:hypothetical protein [Pseudomonadales bacterium]